jgi:tetratricopeptide (TPR) repeat protein
MNVPVRRPLFHRRSESNLYRMFFWVVLILGGIWLIREVQQGDVEPLFVPTATPTRTSHSYVLEGEAQFTAGKLDAAIEAYRQAARLEPNNGEVWANLARIQTYSSALLVTDDQRRQRLTEALESAEKAVEVSPDDSMSYAIRAFAKDWNADPTLYDERQVQAFLTEAEQDAATALRLDSTNTLALVFYAEILVDQQKWSQAQQNIDQALARGEDLMDVYRVNAYVQESLGQYNIAIENYDKAIALTPNLTFLYLRAGANYRTLGFRSPNEETQRQLWEKSLEYFAKAAQINEQLDVKDPAPYLSIARTYSQMGEYFSASRNAQKALEFEPDNADLYGQLGIVYFKSRNYEGSIPALKCAIRGCDEEDSCQARFGSSCEDAGETGLKITGLPLSANTVVYYYTYGSVLAALSRPQENYCAEAHQVFNEVAAQFGTDKDIAGIIAAGEAICAGVAEGNTSSTSSTSATATPTGTITEAPAAVASTATPGS